MLDPQGTTWLDADLRVLAPHDRVVLFGNASGTPVDPVPTDRLSANNAAVGGFSIAALSVAAPKLVQRAMNAVLHRVAKGSLTPESTIAQGLNSLMAAQERSAS